MINLHTKVEVSMFTHYTMILKTTQNEEIGHQQCHHSIECIWLPIWL